MFSLAALELFHHISDPGTHDCAKHCLAGHAFIRGRFCHGIRTEHLIKAYPGPLPLSCPHAICNYELFH